MRLLKFLKYTVFAGARGDDKDMSGDDVDYEIVEVPSALEYVKHS